MILLRFLGIAWSAAFASEAAKLAAKGTAGDKLLYSVFFAVVFGLLAVCPRDKTKKTN